MQSERASRFFAAAMLVFIGCFVTAYTVPTSVAAIGGKTFMLPMPLWVEAGSLSFILLCFLLFMALRPKEAA